MHLKPEDTSTIVLDWGTLKWLVTPSAIPSAESSVGEVIVYPGRGHDVHNHPAAQEVLYVIDGEGLQTVGDSEPFPIKAGDAVFIPTGVNHSTFNTGWRALRLVVTYSPGGEEKGLSSLPDFEEVPVGRTRTWVREV